MRQIALAILLIAGCAPRPQHLYVPLVTTPKTRPKIDWNTWNMQQQLEENNRILQEIERRQLSL